MQQTLFESYICLSTKDQTFDNICTLLDKHCKDTSYLKELIYCDMYIDTFGRNNERYLDRQRNEITSHIYICLDTNYIFYKTSENRYLYYAVNEYLLSNDVKEAINYLQEFYNENNL